MQNHSTNSNTIQVVKNPWFDNETSAGLFQLDHNDQQRDDDSIFSLLKMKAEKEKMSLSCFQIKDFMGDIEGEINQRL